LTIAVPTVPVMAFIEPRSYRLFTFQLDGRLSTLVLYHLPGLSPHENAMELYERFHAIMEREAPGCFQDGRISHLGYVDGIRRAREDGGVDGC
jgi:hypothetical protein